MVDQALQTRDTEERKACSWLVTPLVAQLRFLAVNQCVFAHCIFYQDM